MGRAVGEARFPDGKILFFLYCGTVDIAYSKLWYTLSDLEDNWDGENRQRCSCGNSQVVDLAADYGCGIQWKGKACYSCGAITGGQDPYDSYPDNGLPSWWDDDLLD